MEIKELYGMIKKHGEQIVFSCGDKLYTEDKMWMIDDRKAISIEFLCDAKDKMVIIKFE